MLKKPFFLGDLKGGKLTSHSLTDSTEGSGASPPNVFLDPLPLDPLEKQWEQM